MGCHHSKCDDEVSAVHGRVSALLEYLPRVRDANLEHLAHPYRASIYHQLELMVAMEVKEVWALLVQVFPAFGEGFSTVPFDRAGILAVVQVVYDSLEADPTGVTTMNLSTKRLTSRAFYFGATEAPPYTAKA